MTISSSNGCRARGVSTGMRSEKAISWLTTYQIVPCLPTSSICCAHCKLMKRLRSRIQTRTLSSCRWKNICHWLISWTIALTEKPILPMPKVKSGQIYLNFVQNSIYFVDIRRWAVDLQACFIKSRQRHLFGAKSRDFKAKVGRGRWRSTKKVRRH